MRFMEDFERDGSWFGRCFRLLTGLADVYLFYLAEFANAVVIFDESKNRGPPRIDPVWYCYVATLKLLNTINTHCLSDIPELNPHG